MDFFNKMKELKYKNAREKYLREVIQKIGLIKESEDCIICYVKQELLEKNAKKTVTVYDLQCNGMNTIYNNSRELVDYFNLNKPVYYIFDGICFNGVVNISSLFSNIIFRNCTFSGGIRIFFADNITLESNIYSSLTDSKEYGNAFLYGKIKNLTIKNDQFINDNFYSKFFDNNFGINVETDNINIDHSNICARNHGQINIKAKKAKILESVLAAPEMYLDLDSIVYSKSLLRANGIIIENKNCDLDTEAGFYNVDCPCVFYNNIFYNGTEMVTNYEDYKKNQLELKEKRLTLVNVFSSIRNKLNQSTLVKSASVKENNKLS